MDERVGDPVQVWERCENETELRGWLETFLGLKFPAGGVCEGHCSPFEYVRRAYFEGGDLVVWAPRGGGKTRLAAAVTVLEMMHRGGISVRVLGGSLEQSLRTWEYLLPDLMRLAKGKVEGRTRARRVSLVGGVECGSGGAVAVFGSGAAGAEAAV